MDSNTSNKRLHNSKTILNFFSKKTKIDSESDPIIITTTTTTSTTTTDTNSSNINDDSKNNVADDSSTYCASDAIITSVDEECSDSKHETDSKKLKGTGKRAKTFNSKWKQNRPWLVFVDGLGMFCEYCQKYDKRPFERDTWNKLACKRIRLESVTDHEGARAHKDAVQMELAQKTHIAVAIVPEVSLSNMSQTFSCLYFLCKQRIPHTTNFEPLLDLMEFLQVNLKSKIKVGNNAMYTSRHSIQEMLECMSGVLEVQTLNKLKQSLHYSLMFDETTDCSVNEQMVLRARYINDDGHVEVKFLKILDCLNTAAGEQDVDTIITLNAKNIAKHVTDFVQNNGLKFSCLRGLGTDGAAVMTGVRKGAVKLIQNKQIESQIQNDEPLKCEAVGLHCAAHKLNLAASQAGDSIQYIKKFKDILRQLYDFYQNSAVRSAGLSAIQKLLEEPERKVIEPSSTRWLSIGTSVDRLKEILGSVIISLEHESEERSNAIAQGLYTFLRQYRFISTLLLFCDVLPTINRLSKIFQISNLDYALVATVVASTLNKLEKLKTNDGDNLKTINSYIDNLEKAGVAVVVKQQKVRGTPLNGGTDFENAKCDFDKNVKTLFLDKMILNIRNRFIDNKVMEAFSVFDPLKMVENSECVNYGISHVETLVDRFGGHTEAAAVQEWSDFRQYMNDHLKAKTAREVVFELASNKALKVVYPVMAFLASVYLALPPHTADCERDFSQMKLIKTVLRNRMTERTLDSLMRIVIEGPKLEQFPFETAVKIWAEKKHRRLKV